MTDPADAKKLIRNCSGFEQTFVGTEESTLGVERDVGIDDRQRLKHVLSVGETGTGKTQAMTHAALQDAVKGHGFVFVVPKGAAIDELLAKLPENRYDDIVYLNPAGEDVTPINVLDPYIVPGMDAAAVEHQREIIVSDVVDLFRRQSENWGDRFGRVLTSLLRAHVDLNVQHDAGKTLVDVYDAVIDDDVLREVIDQVNDPVLRNDLTTVKEELTSRELEPLQRRLQDFVENRTVRTVIAAEESGVDFRQAIDDHHIVLVDVQKGAVGHTVSRLVGSIVVTKVWAAAQSRITVPEDDRHPYFLYVDEVQNYAGEASSFASILGEAREYRLGCWLATQYLNKLDTRMRRAVNNNCRTKLVFDPTGSEDVTHLAQMLHGVSKQDLLDLGDYRAAIQTPSDGVKQDAVVVDTYPPWNADRSQIDQVKQAGTRPAATPSSTQVRPSLGAGRNAGGERHTWLLQQAKQHFDAAGGVQVQLLYQDPGATKPDGHIILPNDDIAHLEAEAATLSKPGKVLENLRRAAEHGRECIFVVEQGNAAKLENILADPVDRRGDTHDDEHGSFDYYTVDDDSVTDLDTLRNAEYRIFEATDTGLIQHKSDGETECPELEDNNREDLEAFCLYRDNDGFCETLEQPCVLTDP